MYSLLRLSIAVWVIAATATLFGDTRAASLDDLTSPALQRTMQRMYDDCNRASDGFSICIKSKLITFLDRFAQIESISVADGVRVVRNEPPPVAANSVDGVDVRDGVDNWQATLPRGLEARDDAMTEVLVQKAVRALSERTLKVELPSFSLLDVGRGLEEGI